MFPLNCRCISAEYGRQSQSYTKTSVKSGFLDSPAQTGVHPLRHSEATEAVRHLPNTSSSPSASLRTRFQINLKWLWSLNLPSSPGEAPQLIISSSPCFQYKLSLSLSLIIFHGTLVPKFPSLPFHSLSLSIWCLSMSINQSTQAPWPKQLHKDFLLLPQPLPRSSHSPFLPL